MFDSHCHLNFSSFADDYKNIIADCLKKGIGLINVGSQIDTSRRAIEIANEYPDNPIYTSIGLHPVHISGTEMDEEEIRFKGREEEFDAGKYRALINDKVIAVGEIGLDYWHSLTENTESIKTQKTHRDWKQKQKQGFLKQLEFAAKNDLPVILHARGSKKNPQDAYNEMLEILKSHITHYLLHITGVIHCFGSSKEIAQKFLDLGFYIGFTGIITFKNKSTEKLRDVVKFCPLDRILIETDAPYLAPEPHRGERNLPQYIEFVARKVAEIKGVGFEEVCEQMSENVQKLFFGKVLKVIK